VIKKFIQDNFIALVLAGLGLFFSMESLKQNKAQERIIESAVEQHEVDKGLLDETIKSIYDSIGSNKQKLSILEERFQSEKAKLKSNQHDKEVKINNIPNYSDPKLDSILTNYRRNRDRPGD
jgi:hypothetical protein